MEWWLVRGIIPKLALFQICELVQLTQNYCIPKVVGKGRFDPSKWIDMMFELINFARKQTKQFSGYVRATTSNVQ